MFASLTLDPATYCLLALGGNVLGNYSSLAARLSHWSMFIQVLLALATGVGLTAGFMASALPLPVLVAIMLGLALPFREQAWLRFAMDWLRPASAALKSKMS